ncbi:hypothetical protein DRQ25_15750 [Candidatus Fermentibacteria bacterium]|nr:MAG: hypothetical protein DRQ25_15750 [Candidatus Fermentibacteria bacterium]
MPWKETSVTDERMTFIGRLSSGEKMAPLCREFGVSRVTGYKMYYHCAGRLFLDLTGIYYYLYLYRHTSVWSLIWLLYRSGLKEIRNIIFDTSLGHNQVYHVRGLASIDEIFYWNICDYWFLGKHNHKCLGANAQFFYFS